MRRPRLVPTAAALVSLLLLAACGGQPTQPPAPVAQPPSGQPAPAASKPLAPVTFRFAFHPAGYEAPYALALDKGWYKDAGLNVTLEAGKGSASTDQLVGTDKDTVGEADVSTLVPLGAKGLPVKAIAVFIQKSPLAVGSLAASGIKEPKDLVGRSIAVTPDGLDAQVLPAFLQKVGLTTKQVRVVDVSTQAKESALLDKKVDAMVPLVNGTGPAIEAKSGGKMNYMLFADYGLNMLSIGLIASDTTIRDHPDWLAGIVAASSKAWAYAKDHPDEAVASLARHFDNVDQKVALVQLQASFPLLQTAISQGRPLGWQATQDWQSTVDLMHTYAGVAQVFPPEHYFTNQFIK